MTYITENAHNSYNVGVLKSHPYIKSWQIFCTMTSQQFIFKCCG